MALIRAALVALLLTSCATHRAVDEVFAKFGRTTPGCAVGVAKGGETILARGYGMANLEHAIPIAPETVFEAGSVSKQFTAAALVLLEAEGKLSLADPVRKHVPELDPSADPVTLRHMLEHTSGLRDWGTLVGIAGWPRGTRLHTHAHVVDVLSRQRALNFAPGSRWSYSNSGYNLAAVVAERVSGIPLPRFTAERLFKPAGMTHSSWRDDVTRIVPRRATAYAKRDETYRADMHHENIYGNCCLMTTVGDLLKWNRHLDATPSLARPMESATPSLDYALGLYVRKYRGTREVAHSGSTGGYRAWLARYPEQQLSVALLCNDGEVNPTALGRKVADVFLTGLPPAPAPPKREKGLFREPRLGLVTELETRGYTPIAATPAPDLAPLAGTYVSEEAQATHTIEVKDNQLTIRLGLGEPQPLVHVDGPTFRLGNSTFVTFTGGGYEVTADVDFANAVARVEKLRFVRR